MLIHALTCPRCSPVLAQCMLGYAPAASRSLEEDKRVLETAWTDVSELFMKTDLSLPQVGGQRWVELFLHSKEIY